MKIFLIAAVFAGSLLAFGCQTGPSPEARARDIDQARKDAREQAEFRKGLPPLENAETRGR